MGIAKQAHANDDTLSKETPCAPATDERFLPQHFLALLTEVGSLLATIYDRRSPLSRNQTQLISELLKRDGQTQTELAHALQIHKVSVGIYVSELEVLGLVERRHHPTDRRAKCIFLTELLHSTKHLGIEYYSVIHRVATQGIGSAEYLTMLDSIAVMRANLMALDQRDREREAAEKMP